MMSGWWADDEQMMRGWWGGDKLMMSGWWADDWQMMSRWWADNELMMSRWWADDEQMMSRWWEDDERMMNWFFSFSFDILLAKASRWQQAAAELHKYFLDDESIHRRGLDLKNVYLSTKKFTPDLQIFHTFLVFGLNVHVLMELWFVVIFSQVWWWGIEPWPLCWDSAHHSTDPQQTLKVLRWPSQLESAELIAYQLSG